MAQKIKRGEHIVPAAIGGTFTISELRRHLKRQLIGRSCDAGTSISVCATCNNGPLSELDAELCRRSPISIIAREQLSTLLRHSWDVDHNADNLLLEASSETNGRGMIVYPQMVFESAGPTIRCDIEQLNQFGMDRFLSVFIDSIRAAFYDFKKGKRSRLNPKRIDLPPHLQGLYRLPPRIFTRHIPTEISPKSSFEFHYLNPIDRQLALSTLENWDPSKTFRTWDIAMGSAQPVVGCQWDAGVALRGLAKIAVNLLASITSMTLVNTETFPVIVGIIRGDRPIPPQFVFANGFVSPSDLAQIHAADSAHSFRLTYLDEVWHAYLSFFGGKVGAMVRFSGPNQENWNSADIVVPVLSKDWTFRTSSTATPLNCSVELSDPKLLIPSAELLNVQQRVRFLRGSSRDKS